MAGYGWAPPFLGVAWALVSVVALARFRPLPRRLRGLLCIEVAGAGKKARSWPSRRLLTERLGRSILRACGRNASASTCRRLGSAVVAALPAGVVLPLAAPAAAVLGWMLPAVLTRRRDRARLLSVAADLPEVVDLLVMAIGAGLTVPLAVAAVARRSPGRVATELGRASEEAGLGRRLADALDDIPSRAGESVRPLVAALVASERYGAPLAAGLDRLAAEVRRDRRRRAEEAARKVPVKLLFPLVTCTLPAFGLLTVAPLIAGAMRSLHL